MKHLKPLLFCISILFIFHFPIDIQAKLLENDNSIVISDSQSIENQSISKDLYVSKDAVLFIDGNVTITGNVYNWGQILAGSNSTLIINGTLNTLSYVAFKPSTVSQYTDGYDYGHFQSSGNLSIQTLNVSDNYIDTVIPEIEDPAPNPTPDPVQPSPIPTEPVPCQSVYIAKDNEVLSNITLDKPIYIPQNVTISLSGTNSFSDMYVFGTVNSTGSITITGTLNCLHYGSSFSAGNYSYGYFNHTGNGNINKLNVTDNYLSYGIPEVTHTPVTSVKTKATCTNSGASETYCQYCNIMIGTSVIPPTGHMYDSWSETKAPTALENGIESRKCLVCGDIQTRETSKIKAIVHLNKDTISVKQGSSSTDLKITSWSDGDFVSTWASSDTSIATVTSDGKITAIKAGTATITVTMKSGCSASCNVTVEQSNTTVKPSKVKLNKTKLTIKKGKKYTLKLKGTTKKVKWKTSNKKIATVNKNGKVTAKKNGKAIITAKVGKKTYKCRITVK